MPCTVVDAEWELKDGLGPRRVGLWSVLTSRPSTGEGGELTARRA
jgi:hypothetical protein